jgi:anthranilate phosphoribosyltransferase
MPPRELLERVLDRRDLSQQQAEDLLTYLTGADAPPALAGAFLAGLRAKGVVADEVRGFAQVMRRLARKPPFAVTRAIDIVGTGGDGSGSLNISTGTALLTAACGLPVLKHGNRSISSRAGSADVLEALGLAIPFDEAAAEAAFTSSGFAFLFAPHYHPAMKAIAQVRAALGVRTVFNILGPLTNPAAPPFHLIGAFSREVAELLAATMSGMPIERTFVVHGAEGWDEPTPVGPFTIFDVRPGRIEVEVRDPAAYGLAPCTPADLVGGDPAHNAGRLRAVLYGEDLGAYRDCLMLGTALALEVAGEVREPREGMERAAAALDGGQGRRVLDTLVTLQGRKAEVAS